MILICVFIVLVIGVFAFISGLDARTQEARIIRGRLASIESAVARDPNSEAALLRDELLSTVPALDRVLKHSPAINKLQKILNQAGLTIRAGKMVLICASVGSAVALIANHYATFLISVVSLAVGCAIPIMVILYLRSRRFNKFQDLLPQAIELVGRAVRSGHSLSSSLEVISTELPEPVAGEFRLVYEEQRFGLPMRDALLNLVERVPLVDVRFFSVAVMIQREAGGNLAEILDKLAQVMRERVKIMRQVRVYTAQGRMSMIILMAMPFVLGIMINIIAPASMQLLFNDPLGKRLIGLGIGMLFTGFIIIRKIVTIKV
jgi:tight adherence protein B